MPFRETHADKLTVTWTGAAPAAAALLGALVVLFFAVWIYIDGRGRDLLRRQSLQILISVQIMSLVYSATYLGEMLISGPTRWCNACIILTLWASNYIDFCIMLIPVNLQLVLVHDMHTEGWARYYMAGSLIAATITAIPGAVTNVWGWDPEALICWISIEKARQRDAWQVGAFYAWLLLSAIVATVSTCMVLAHLLSYARSSGVKFLNAHRISSSTGILMRSIAWRIMFYPLILIFTNSISAAANFTITSQDGIHSETTYIIWVFSGVLYGIMPLLYALVTLFIDPCFTRAIRGLFGNRPMLLDDMTTHSTSNRGSTALTSLQIAYSQHVVVVRDGESELEEGQAGLSKPTIFAHSSASRTEDYKRDSARASVDGGGESSRPNTPSPRESRTFRPALIRAGYRLVYML